ncbi:hypothetical protein N7489_009519 [Penicillium chrysogenum]|uniref:Uncharacterized protein n=1 Tax=Penicillium chrysogenum TaxID=5076 RepID=A0ABQ8WX61_PENCH|nr:uncharacterized protein N7489_009519 [Penicillium chrysogenum]KAJ5228811.1 hypothetical protein N7489_009519 [Penicillium chrysogenum]KAJ5258213.1 hypothetical protein N7524_009769 [Penicillium chrysogenum]KAJ5283555.1 hypothetical protein N7505_001535 [Penicillium chrysogenum]KAJ6168643.1 hypothetical protein N7497_001486 [Penicillium chrysogenum]
MYRSMCGFRSWPTRTSRALMSANHRPSAFTRGILLLPRARNSSTVTSVSISTTSISAIQAVRREAQGFQAPGWNTGPALEDIVLRKER